MNRQMTCAVARVAIELVRPGMADAELVALVHEVADLDEMLDATFAAFRGMR